MPDPERFTVSRGTLAVDWVMARLISTGGVVVIIAVFAIFVFILSQIFPLFVGAKVSEKQQLQLPAGDYEVVDSDEWTELPFAVTRDGHMLFVDLQAGGEVKVVDPPLAGANTLTAMAYRPQTKAFALGTADGKFGMVTVKYSAKFADGKRSVAQELDRGAFLPLGIPGAPIRLIAAGDAGASRLVAVAQESEGKPHLHAVELVRKKSLMGLGPWTAGRDFDLSGQLTGTPVALLVAATANSLLVLQDDGEVAYFFMEGDKFSLRQRFRPFGDLAKHKVESMDYILGDVSLVFTNSDGVNRIYSLYVKPGDRSRTFGLTKELPALGNGASLYSASLRNKSFLIGSGNKASLRHATTESIRWEKELGFELAAGAVGGKYESFLLLDKTGRLHVYDLHDPHPETSFAGLFGKVWYEGASEPKYEWQSTGGSDEFEPKISLVPLIFGTLKGTFYAMLFAVPIAIFGALYTSQFLRPEHRAVIKPTMEIMASLPSVVLGFLAALWLAPLLDNRVPSVIALLFLLPITAFAVGYLWSGLPVRYRILVKPGYEFVAFAPLLLAVTWLGWHAGPHLENFVFAFTDPTTGARVADFRQWWPRATGTPYEMRNCLVVGFMMGFAVIPLIFTIADDALSNVPDALRSGSLALGASRWQTAVRLVLPTASPGIFSALMIGLGRAVGETMIMVMATGNTPIMDGSIFRGMRTLSANIAVELSEAPQNGTLYRTLFLGAMVLFLMTFFVNTIAEVMRQHLRQKYKTV